MWIPDVGAPAPTMVLNGWTEDLFPPIQAISFANAEAQRHPEVPIHLRFADIGHPRAQDKVADRNTLSDDAIAFINHFMLDGGTAARRPTSPVRRFGPSGSPVPSRLPPRDPSTPTRGVSSATGR